MGVRDDMEMGAFEAPEYHDAHDKGKEGGYSSFFTSGITNSDGLSGTS
jgi:hypothetical protein